MVFRVAGPVGGALGICRGKRWSGGTFFVPDCICLIII